MDDEFDPRPCDTCIEQEYCDKSNARYCCLLCKWYGVDDCDNCIPLRFERS